MIYQIPFTPNPALGETIAALQAETSNLAQVHVRIRAEYPEITFNDICNEILARSVPASVPQSQEQQPSSSTQTRAANLFERCPIIVDEEVTHEVPSHYWMQYYYDTPKECTEILQDLFHADPEDDEEWKMCCCFSSCCASFSSSSRSCTCEDAPEMVSTTSVGNEASSTLLGSEAGEQQFFCSCLYDIGEDCDGFAKDLAIECWLQNCNTSFFKSGDSDNGSSSSDASLLFYLDGLGYIDLRFLCDDE